jgi:hypothetical protein
VILSSNSEPLDKNQPGNWARALRVFRISDSYFSFSFLGWSETESVWYVFTIGLLYHVAGPVSGITGGGNRNTWWKTYVIATLSIRNPALPDRVSNPGFQVKNQRLTSWALTRPTFVSNCHYRIRIGFSTPASPHSRSEEIVSIVTEDIDCTDRGSRWFLSESTDKCRSNSFFHSHMFTLIYW